MTKSIIKSLRFRKENPLGLDTEKLGLIIEKAYVDSNQRPKEMKTKKSFAPSSIGYGHGTCARFWKLAFDGAEFDEQIDASSFAVMSDGSDSHKRIQNVLRYSGLLIEEEKKVVLEDPPVFGFIDVIIRGQDGNPVVGEIKTTRQEVWAHKQATMKPSPNHLLQVLIYMYATDIKVGFLLYENRNDKSLIIIPIYMDGANEQILNDALDWLRKVRKNWEAGELPTRPWTRKSKICKACPINRWCWEEQPDGEVDIEPMDVPKL